MSRAHSTQDQGAPSLAQVQFTLQQAVSKFFNQGTRSGNEDIGCYGREAIIHDLFRGSLTNPDTCIPEHAHPGTVFTPVTGVPRVLYCTEDTFRMRHHDGKASVVRRVTGLTGD